MGETVCIHVNDALHQQRRYGSGLKKAFEHHGYTAYIVNSPTGDGDIHVVLGPHFAKPHWLGHSRVILLDRCYYRGDPDHVSLGWLRPDGGRTFFPGTGRKPPAMGEQRTGDRSLFLADFNGRVEEADTVRYHPSDGRRANSKGEILHSLAHDLATHDIAIGYNTTALVTAALAGLRIVCKGEQNILNEPDWLALLPYADWGYHELNEAIEHLLCHSPC